MGRKSTKQTTEITVSPNAHLDPVVVAWFATCERTYNHLQNKADYQLWNIRSQGWKRHKEKGDPQVYADRDTSKYVWDILSPLIYEDLQKAIDLKIAEYEAKQDAENELRDKLYFSSYRDNYSLAPASVLLETVQMIIASGETNDFTLREGLKELISSLHYNLNLSTIQTIVDKLAPYKTPEPKKEEE